MKFLFAAWFISTLCLISTAAVSSTRRHDAPTIILQSIVEGESNFGWLSFEGHLSIVNYSSVNLCVHRDLVENENSPYATVRRNGKFGRGLPPPPRVTGVVTIVPGENLSFRQIVAYGNKPEKRAVIEVAVDAWWCDGSRNFNLLSNKLRL